MTEFTGGTTPAYFSTERPYEHEHVWEAIGNYSGGSDGARCKVRGCRAELSYWQVDDRLNKYDALKRIYRRIQAADSPDLKLPVEMSCAMAEMTALLAEQEK